MEYITSHDIEMGHYKEFFNWIKSYLKSNPYAKSLPRYSDTLNELERNPKKIANHVNTLNTCTKEMFDDDPCEYIALHDYLKAKCILPE